MFSSCEKIRDLIKDSLGDTFKDYFIDEPGLVPTSELPALCVAPISTSIDILDNQRDQYTFTIDVLVIIDARIELKKFKKEIIGSRYLTEIMEGKDSSGNLRPKTILYILRNNLRLDKNWYIRNAGSIEYGMRARTTELGEQFVTKESTLRLEVIRIQNRP